MLNISLSGPCWGKGGGLVYIFIVALFAEAKVKPGEERRGFVRNCDGEHSADIILLGETLINELRLTF